MPDCDYCQDSFDSEEAYLSHLESAHEGELSAIDQRRVGDVETEQSDNIGMIVIGVLTVVSFAIVIYLAFFTGGGAADEPHGHGTVHEHGTMEISIDGESLNLHSSEFVEQNRHFHFHNNPQYELGGGLYVWHTHSQGVTLEYALETIIDVDDDGSELTIDGDTYDASDPDTEISIEVNDESVDLADHELDGITGIPDGTGEGDDVHIEITTQ